MKNENRDEDINLTPMMRVALEKRRDVKIQEKLLEDSTIRHIEITLSAKKAREEYTAILAALNPDEEADLLQVILTNGDPVDAFSYLRAYNAGLI